MWYLIFSANLTWKWNIFVTYLQERFQQHDLRQSIPVLPKKKKKINTQDWKKMEKRQPTKLKANQNQDRMNKKIISWDEIVYET